LLKQGSLIKIKIAGSRSCGDGSILAIVLHIEVKNNGFA